MDKLKPIREEEDIVEEEEENTQQSRRSTRSTAKRVPLLTITRSPSKLMRHQMKSHPSPVNCRLRSSTTPSDGDNSRSKDSAQGRMFIGKPMKISSKPPTEKVVKPIPTSPRKKMVSEKKVVKKAEAEKQVPVDAAVEKKQPQADKKPQPKKD